MNAHSPKVILEFCTLCGWAYECWLNHRELFDDNPRADALKNSFAGEALGRLSVISHEYSLLQIVKLHDKAIVSGRVTLGIDYILQYGGWSPEVKQDLDVLAFNLDRFASGLRTVRNRLLSHNDLTAVLSDTILGEFEKNADIAYFRSLQKFVDIVHDEVIGGPWPFNDLVKNDVAALMSVVKS